MSIGRLWARLRHAIAAAVAASLIGGKLVIVDGQQVHAPSVATPLLLYMHLHRISRSKDDAGKDAAAGAKAPQRP